MTEAELESKSILAEFFNLHPLDAYQYALTIQQEMQEFVDAFKERIQVQIEYSKSLFKIAKLLQKHIKPQTLSPLSYICSAFKVEHEQRGRNALELAQYLHTEIEVICQTVLQNHQAQSKKIQKSLKKWYKDAENCQEAFQKSIKKYFKSRQEWQERVINKNILIYTPGVTPYQKDKAIAKVDEGKSESWAYYDKYMDSLNAFNHFAAAYNQQVGQLMAELEQAIKQELSMQADSLRKLIVSQVSMFKNIEYDLLNISKQMQDLPLQTQIDLFVNTNKLNFSNPIIPNSSKLEASENLKAISLKVDTGYTLMEETLLCIESAQFSYMLQNKNNSTLRHCLTRIWKKMSGQQQQGASSDCLTDFEQVVKTNRIVKEMRMDNEQQITEKLRPEEAYSISFKILTNIANLCHNEQSEALKQQEKVQLLRSYFSLHHFYRFIAWIFLQQYGILHQTKIQHARVANNFVQILQALISEAYRMKDVFVIRGIIELIFSCYWTQLQVNCYIFRHPSICKLPIWSNSQLWQAAVFEQNYQQISLLSSGERSELRDVYIMRQKNVVFSGLVAYSHYMIMLGLDAKEVRHIIGKQCQIYNLWEEHERDLTKSIASSEKQYLQTANFK